MSKKQHHEEHVDETWLLPYSDMLTLLLALFIVMFAMSQVDKRKLQEISKEFNIIFAGGTGVLKDDGSKIVPTDEAGTSDKKNSVIEQDKMNNLKSMLEKQISEKGYADKVKVDLNAEGLDISIQDTVLFNSGHAEILNEFYPLLTEISNMLRGISNNFRIGGHTDNVPINNSEFRSNWDLSYGRAANVMHFMVDKCQMSPEKFVVQAYGEYNPKFDNSTPEGRSKNRRVDILVQRNYPLATATNAGE